MPSLFIGIQFHDDRAMSRWFSGSCYWWFNQPARRWSLLLLQRCLHPASSQHRMCEYASFVNISQIIDAIVGMTDFPDEVFYCPVQIRNVIIFAFNFICRSNTSPRITSNLATQQFPMFSFTALLTYSCRWQTLHSSISLWWPDMSQLPFVWWLRLLRVQIVVNRRKCTKPIHFCPCLL